MEYLDVFKRLNENKIRYLVVGGLAVNLYGFTRLTLDLDLVIALDHESKKSFYRIMKQLKYITKKPKLAYNLMHDLYKSDKIQVITFYRDEFELIDVFIKSPFDFEEAYKKRKIFKIDGNDIPTVPYDTLIEMKNKSGREADLRDIGYLKQVQNEKKKQ